MTKNELSTKEKLECCEEALEQATIMLTKFMAFVSVNGLIEEFYDFKSKFESFLESGIDFNNENLEEKFKEYIGMTSEGIRNA